MELFRREFLHLMAGAAAVPAAVCRFAWAQDSSQKVRVATGLLATWQCTAWLGAEAGIFKKHGIDMTLPAIAVGGPQAAAGVIRGDWEFAHTGTLPVAEEVLKGHDIVILATPTSEFPNSFIMTRKEITALAQLRGKTVGVLTETGQTSVAAQITVEKAGAIATYVPLIKFDRIYAALANGEIDAGALPIDLRFTGQVHYGWNAFPIHEFGTPSIFASTRKLIASNRNLVMNVMKGFVETIHLFKTQAGYRSAFAAALSKDRRPNGSGGPLHISRAGVSKGSTAVVSRNANAAGPACGEIPGRGIAQRNGHCGPIIHRRARAKRLYRGSVRRRSQIDRRDCNSHCGDFVNIRFWAIFFDRVGLD